MATKSNKEQNTVTIFINADGWLRSPYITDATISMSVSKEDWQVLKVTTNGYNWRYINNSFKEEQLLSAEFIRQQRQQKCFNIIDNRSQLWYNHLTNSQKNELDQWYQEWLDAPTKLIMPVKPSWL